MFDKQIAFQAQKLGAEIKIRCSMHSISEIKASVSHNSHYILKSSEGTFACNYFVDARGVTSIIQRDREGILQSAQYEVYAPWIRGTHRRGTDRLRKVSWFLRMDHSNWF